MGIIYIFIKVNIILAVWYLSLPGLVLSYYGEALQDFEKKVHERTGLSYVIILFNTFHVISFEIFVEAFLENRLY